MVSRASWLAVVLACASIGTAQGAPLFGYTLAPVQVTAARADETTDKTPQAVQVIGEKDIETLGAISAKDALALADSLDLSEAVHTSTSPVAGNAVMIRGMNTNHTLILVDGMRMADEDTSQTRNVYLLSRIPASQIARIEILRGAGSALYGSDAMGGVINIITKVPGKRETVWQAWTGTQPMGQMVGIGSGRLGRWNVNATGTWETLRPVAHPQSYTTDYAGRDVLTEGEDFPEFGHRSSWRVDGTYEFQNANANQLRITASGMNESLKTVYADSTGLGLVLTKNQRELTDRERRDAALVYTGKTERHAYSLKAYWSEMTKHSETFNDRAGFRPPLESLLGGMFPKYDYDSAKYSLYGLEGRDTFESGAHTVTYGGEFLRMVYRGTRLSADKIPTAYDMDSWAGYISDQWNVSAHLYLTPSLRFERNSRSGSAVIPKIGATYMWNDTTRLKGEYGSGYRAPSVSELFLHMNHSTPMGIIQVTGNPELSPERSQSWSTTFEKEWGPWFGKAAYFQNTVKNLIEAVQAGASPLLYRYENINRAKIHGAEWELGRHLTDRLTVKVSGTALHARNETEGTRLDGRAGSRWQAELRYEDGNPYGWSGMLWDTWTDNYYFREKEYSWNTLNISAEKRWGERLSANAGIGNLLNRKDKNLYLTGRSWNVSVQFKF